MSLKRVHTVSLEYPLYLGDGYLIESTLLPVHIKDIECFFDVEPWSFEELFLHLQHVILDPDQCKEQFLDQLGCLRAYHLGRLEFHGHALAKLPRQSGVLGPEDVADVRVGQLPVLVSVDSVHQER